MLKIKPNDYNYLRFVIALVAGIALALVASLAITFFQCPNQKDLLAAFMFFFMVAVGVFVYWFRKLLFYVAVKIEKTENGIYKVYSLMGSYEFTTREIVVVNKNKIEIDVYSGKMTVLASSFENFDPSKNIWKELIAKGSKKG